MASDDERVALMATEAVLNRGAGGPRDHSDEDTRHRVNLSVLSGEERATLAGMLSMGAGNYGQLSTENAPAGGENGGGHGKEA
jgi:hypothetical protein